MSRMTHFNEVFSMNTKAFVSEPVIDQEGIKNWHVLIHKEGWPDGSPVASVKMAKKPSEKEIHDMKTRYDRDFSCA